MADASPSPRPLIAGSILELIGATPMVRLNRIAPKETAEIVAKLESRNPGGSVKDRIGLAMIEAAEREGKLRPGDTIVEPTSGNTGIGLAIVAAVKGYRLIITMPDDKTMERRVLLENYGAQVVSTPGRKGMQGAVDKAREIAEKEPRTFMPQQFQNPANPDVHRRTTAREILAATEGKIDAFVAGVGTGGTITGVGEVLKRELGDRILVVAVEPARSPVLSGGQPACHGIQGIGAGFVPPVLNRAVFSEILTVDDDEAFKMAGRLAREEGISAGISAGAAVVGSVRIAQRLGPGRRVVTVFPDSWDKYVSTEVQRRLASLDFII